MTFYNYKRLKINPGKHVSCLMWMSYLFGQIIKVSEDGGGCISINPLTAMP